jgi:hypothetical protein
MNVKVTKVLLGLFALMASLLASPLRANAPGYHYELLYWDHPYDGEWIDYSYLAVNSSGEVVFVTKNTVYPNGSEFKFYTASQDSAPSLVTEAIRFDDTHTIPIFYGGTNPGIGNDGVVSIPLTWPLQDEQGAFAGYERGFRLYEPGVGAIGDIRRTGGIDKSSGRLSLDREIGNSGYPQCVSNIGQLIALGVSSESSSTIACYPQLAQINDLGAVATLTYGQDNSISVAWATPPGDSGSVSLGTWPTGVNSSRTLGFNNLGWMSYATNTNEVASPEVMIISPAGQVFTVADTTSGQFLNFPQPRSHANSGTSLNNFNRTSFVADLPASPQIGESIWVGDTSGDPPRLAIDQSIVFANGWRAELTAFVNDITSHGANSMSDLGEIALIANSAGLYDDQDVRVNGNGHLLLLAIPEVGGEPGNPILPEAEDNPPNGFRFRGRCWRSDIAAIPGSCDPFGGVDGPTPRTFYDPPVAVGYDFKIDVDSVGAFESVLVPIPLAGGDHEFLLTAGGETVPLHAGTAVHFSSVTADPARAFTISEIDAAEELDPSDPTAFVIGLTFVPGTDEAVSFTMAPVEFDPDVIWKNGFESP